MSSKYRIRSGAVRLNDSMTLGTIVDGVFQPRHDGKKSAAWLADPKNAADLQEWLRYKLAKPPRVDWPPIVPMAPVPVMVIALAPREAEPVPGWRYFCETRAGRKVYRSIATDELPIPDGWCLAAADEPITDHERAVFMKAAVEFADRRGYSLEPRDLDDTALRRQRGDAWYYHDIHDSPVHFSDGQLMAPGVMGLDSRHVHLIVREYAENGKNSWTACTGTGGYMYPVPGPPSYASQREAIAVGLAWWRQGVFDRIAEITEARGGTCAWGLPIQPLENPVLTVIPADETARE
jgi:hypothetical protein